MTGAFGGGPYPWTGAFGGGPYPLTGAFGGGPYPFTGAFGGGPYPFTGAFGGGPYPFTGALGGGPYPFTGAFGGGPYPLVGNLGGCGFLRGGLYGFGFGAPYPPVGFFILLGGAGVWTTCTGGLTSDWYINTGSSWCGRGTYFTGCDLLDPFPDPPYPEDA